MSVKFTLSRLTIFIILFIFTDIVVVFVLQLINQFTVRNYLTTNRFANTTVGGVNESRSKKQMWLIKHILLANKKKKKKHTLQLSTGPKIQQIGSIKIFPTSL